MKKAITRDYPDLQTDHLNLRLLTLDDKEAILTHFSDPEVTLYMDIEPMQDLKEAEELIRYHLEDEGCRWGIFDKANGHFVGTIGFHYLRNRDQFIAELGYDLSKSYWGKGLMSETLKEVMTFGFKKMKLDIIDATIEPENSRSINLLEKFRFKRETELNDGLIYFYLTQPIYYENDRKEEGLH